MIPGPVESELIKAHKERLIRLGRPTALARRVPLSAVAPKRKPVPRSWDYTPDELPPEPRWRSICREIAINHHTTLSKLLSDDRSANVVAARQEAYWRLVVVEGIVKSVVERHFDRDRTTIDSGIARHLERVREQQSI